MWIRLRIRMRMADEDVLALRWSRMRMRMTSMWTVENRCVKAAKPPVHRQRSLRRVTGVEFSVSSLDTRVLWSGPERTPPSLASSVEETGAAL